MRERQTEIERLAVKKIRFDKYFNEHIAGIKPGVKELNKGTRALICPFHDDINPSFHFWYETETCYCFGCHKGGDVISVYKLFEEQYKNRVLTDVQAAKELLDLYNVDYAYLQESNSVNLSVFEQALKELNNEKMFDIAPNVMTVGTFIQQNREILENFGGTDEESMEARIEYFTILDRRTQLVMGGFVDNSDKGKAL